MNPNQQPITAQHSLPGLKAINQLAAIALKAHSNNPSPVDIKQELALMDPEMLNNLLESTAQLIKANTPINTGQ